RRSPTPILTKRHRAETERRDAQSRMAESHVMIERHVGSFTRDEGYSKVDAVRVVAWLLALVAVNACATRGGSDTSHNAPDAGRWVDAAAADVAQPTKDHSVAPDALEPPRRDAADARDSTDARPHEHDARMDAPIRDAAMDALDAP